MKKTVLAAAAALAFSPAAVLAQDYQMEGGIHYTGIDLDKKYSNFSREDNFGADLTFHLNQVSTAGHPLNEAGFLERSTNVSAAYNYWDKLDTDVFSLGGEAFVQDFYASAGVDINHANKSGVSNTTDFNVRLGFLPIDGLLLTLGYDREENGYENKHNKWKDLNIISLGGKYVTPLNNGMSVNGEAEVGFRDDDDDTVEFALGGDLYFTNYASAGIFLSDSDLSEDKTEVGIRGKYFVTPLISAEAFVANNYLNEKKAVGFGVGGKIRF